MLFLTLLSILTLIPSTDAAILRKCGVYPGTNIPKPCDPGTPGLPRTGPEVCSATQLARGCYTSELEVSPPQYVCDCPDTSSSVPSEERPANDIRSSAEKAAYERVKKKFDDTREAISFADLLGVRTTICYPGRGWGALLGTAQERPGFAAGTREGERFWFLPENQVKFSKFTAEVKAQFDSELSKYGGEATVINPTTISLIWEQDHAQVGAWRVKTLVRKAAGGGLLTHSEIDEYGLTWETLTRELYPELKPYHVCEAGPVMLVK